MAEYSELLRRILPLTPRGIAAFKRAGRKKMTAYIVKMLEALPLDDVAHLNALTGFLADERTRAKRAKGQ